MDLNRVIPVATDLSAAEVVLLRRKGDCWEEIASKRNATILPGSWWPDLRAKAECGDVVVVEVRGPSARREFYAIFPEGTRITDRIILGNGPEMFFCTDRQIPKALRRNVFGGLV